MAKTRSKVDRTCVVCGVEFLAARSDAVYCGSACRGWAFQNKVPVFGPRPRKPRFRLYEPFTFCG